MYFNVGVGKFFSVDRYEILSSIYYGSSSKEASPTRASRPIKLFPWLAVSMTMVGFKERWINMGKSNRQYIENVARTLMGQLGIKHGDVGVDQYHHDTLSAGTRQKIFLRVFQDLRREHPGTLVKQASYGIVDDPGWQEGMEGWPRLHNGQELCSVNHFHYHVRKHWLDGVEKDDPITIVRHMAASAICCAMYDLVVKSKPKFLEPIDHE